MIMPEWMDSGVAALVGVASGWMAGSLTKVNRKELRSLSEQMDQRIKQIESDIKQHVTRTEFREALLDIRADLQQIHTALLQR